MRFERCLLVALGFLAAALASEPALAQRSLFGRSQNTLVGLAANEAVQKDLGCSQYEMNKLRDLQDRYRRVSQEELSGLGISFQNFRSLSDEQRNAASAKMGEVYARKAAEFAPRLKELLSPDQLKRLRQIQIQAAGIDALLEPEMVADLQLSEEQKTSLTALRDEYSRRTQGLFRGDGDQGDRSARTREIEEERDRKAGEVLTSLQREKLIELQGEPFDVSQIRSRRGN
jgi:hypothetical protein